VSHSDEKQKSLSNSTRNAIADPDFSARDALQQ
jgi:hypothetical protein